MKRNLFRDSLGEFDNLSPSLRSDLRDAYTDMAMANNIVWLVTEFRTKSKDLEASYIKLCSKIAERLTKIWSEPLRLDT